MSGTTYRDSKVKEKGVARNAEPTKSIRSTSTRHATSMRSFSEPNPMRTLGQSRGGSAHTREFEDTAWERLRNAAQTSMCCCGRRPSPQQSTIGAKSVPLLQKQLSQPTWQYCSRWGAEIALQGARLRLSNAYLAFSAQPLPTDRAYENTSTEFDPSGCTWYAAEAAPNLGGPPEGQDRY